MPTTTTNYSLNKPNVNSADDEDEWGTQLNENFDAIDLQMKANEDQAAKASPAVLAKTANYTIVAGDFGTIVLADATGGAFTVTFPDPSSVGSGFCFGIKKTDNSANAITGDGDGNDIDGSSTVSLTAQHDTFWFHTDGSEWFITSKVTSTVVVGTGTSVKQTTGTSVPNNTATLVAFDGENFDDSSWHDNATNNSRVTVNFDGRVLLSGQIDFGASDNGPFTIEVLKNGTAIRKAVYLSFSGSANTILPIPGGVVACADGDYFEIQVTQITGSTKTTGPTYTFFDVTRMK